MFGRSNSEWMRMMRLLVRSKGLQPKSVRLIYLICSLLLLNGCGGDSADLDRATKAAELTKEAYDRGASESKVVPPNEDLDSSESKVVPPNEDLDYWNDIDEVDDFGDKTFMLTTFSEDGVGPSKTPPYGESLHLMAACLGKDSTTDGKFYIVVNALAEGGDTGPKVIGSVKNLQIRFDAGNPTKIQGYVRGSSVVHLEKASKYVSKILNASTFSVKFEAQDITYAGTFQVQGFSKYLSNFKSAGCSIGMD
jgi:hypothetical protein